MGKASSAKKVARAARAGGKRTGQRRQLGFPMAVVAIVVAGVGLVTFAKASGESTDDSNPPQPGDHWHAAYGVYVCDRFIADFSDRGPDRLGIHTHDDGLVHIHPFSGGAGGRNATLAKFFDQVDLEVTDSEIQLPLRRPVRIKDLPRGRDHLRWRAGHDPGGALEQRPGSGPGRQAGQGHHRRHRRPPPHRGPRRLHVRLRAEGNVDPAPAGIGRHPHQGHRRRRRTGRGARRRRPAVARRRRLDAPALEPAPPGSETAPPPSETTPASSAPPSTAAP